jgi:type II secretory pathway component PulF
VAPNSHESGYNETKMSSAPDSLALDHLTAMLEEMAALVRAGVPLEKGLLSVGRGAPRKLRRLAESLAERLQNGETLPEALQAHGRNFPPVFRAVVDAGLRSGQLAACLESLVGLSRRLADLRRTVRLAFAYPLSLMLLSYTLMVGFVLFVVPPLVSMMTDSPGAVRGGTRWTASVLTALHASVAWWGPALPGALLLIAAFSSYGSGRAGLLRPNLSLRLFGWIRSARKLVNSATSALAADVLAMLVQRGVPLDQAVVLAAEATGKPKCRAAAGELAERIRRGEPIDAAGLAAAGLPATAAWVLSGKHPPAVVLETLHRTAEAHAIRADDLAERMRLWLPVLLVLTIGGGVTLLYGLAVFGPWLELLREMLERLND